MEASGGAGGGQYSPFKEGLPVNMYSTENTLCMTKESNESCQRVTFNFVLFNFVSSLAVSWFFALLPAPKCKIQPLRTISIGFIRAMALQ